MYEYIQGILKRSTPNEVVIDIYGIGYKIYIPLSTYNNLPEIGEKLLLYISPVIKEDSHTLFGFLDEGQRDLFDKIKTVSGIGPKTALALMGYLDISEFQRAVLEEDTLSISKVPGIGKKTAERLIMEMRDKLPEEKLLENRKNSTSSHIFDAINALVHLGYNHAKARKIIRDIANEDSDEKDVGKLVSLALKRF